MNALLPPERQAVELVDIIDLKWLLSAHGHHVHVEQLQKDPDYARRCLEIAANSPYEAVRRTAARIGERMGFNLFERK